jgi:hypothetical protein
MTCTYFIRMFRLGELSEPTPTACGYFPTARSPNALIRCFNGRLATSWKTFTPSKVLSSSRHSNWVDFRLPNRVTGLYTTYYMSVLTPISQEDSGEDRQDFYT